MVRVGIEVTDPMIGIERTSEEKQYIIEQLEKRSKELKKNEPESLKNKLFPSK
jgi:hypothetical protein